MNKKGQYEVGFIWVSLILLVIFIVILSFLSFPLLSSSKTVEENLFYSRQMSSNFNINSYLKSPVIFQNQEFTVQELLLFSYYNNEYELFDKTTLNYLNPVYSNKECNSWNMKIYKNDLEVHAINNVIGLNLNNLVNQFTKDYNLLEFSIPLVYEDEELSLKVFEIC